jgi:dihydroorotase-like cyclic amidohydrolase
VHQLLDASSIVITGGQVVDASGARKANVRVREGKVVDVAPGLQPTGDEASLDASGCMVSPGFVDLHVHLR